MRTYVFSLIFGSFDIEKIFDNFLVAFMPPGIFGMQIMTKRMFYSIRRVLLSPRRFSRTTFRQSKRSLFIVLILKGNISLAGLSPRRSLG